MQKFSRALEDIHWPTFVAITVSNRDDLGISKESQFQRFGIRPIIPQELEQRIIFTEQGHRGAKQGIIATEKYRPS
jgi:hypothetical protein